MCKLIYVFYPLPQNNEQIIMTDKNKQSVVLSAKRTPVGRFFGGLSRVPAPTLGSFAIKGAIDSAGIDKDQVDECLMGCVLRAGWGQTPAVKLVCKPVYHTLFRQQQLTRFVAVVYSRLCKATSPYVQEITELWFLVAWKTCRTPPILHTFAVD